MRRSIALLLAATLVLTACGTVRESRLNPFNWFGRDREVREVAPNDNPLIPTRTGFFQRRGGQEIYPGQPIDVVREVVVERVPGGAIVRATGVSQVQDLYDVQLTPVNEDEVPVDGVLAYRLEGVVPETPIAGGPERVRTVTAARVLTDQDLAGVRTIRVSGQQNARETRRR